MAERLGVQQSRGTHKRLHITMVLPPMPSETQVRRKKRLKQEPAGRRQVALALTERERNTDDDGAFVLAAFPERTSHVTENHEFAAFACALVSCAGIAPLQAAEREQVRMVINLIAGVKMPFPRNLSNKRVANGTSSAGHERFDDGLPAPR